MLKKLWRKSRPDETTAGVESSAKNQLDAGPADLAEGHADIAYQNFLAVARIDPDTVDFTQLRQTYAQSSRYVPYNVKNGPDRALEEMKDFFQYQHRFNHLISAIKLRSALSGTWICPSR